MKKQVSVNQLIVLAAVFLTAFANVAFFRNSATTFAGQSNAMLHLVSLGIVLFCLIILFLSLFSFRRVIKPVLMLLLLVSAFAAYFMDTYNIVIDHDMLLNVAATDSAESGDLVTPQLVKYVLLMALVPSYLIWDIPVLKLTKGEAWLARAKLVGGALAGLVAMVLIFSSFYASFVREHKTLRYYSNPLTPIYSAYKFTRKDLIGRNLKTGDVQVKSIGTDAAIPATDIERELVIMVVGETARADRFSLNGYERRTNPRLEQEKVVSFKRVESCGTSTAISVPCMFDVEDREQFDLSDAAATWNVLDVLHHAGVNVLWRDNNSNSKGVADRMEFEDFRSPEVNPVCDIECRDVGMLSGLQEYIDSHPAGDILIVLHQMGSHGPAYYKRYPPEFAVFAPTCDSSELDKCSREEINNAYDNTILYTDHFLAEVIGFLRSNDVQFETVMIYASDHGESLGENGIYLHGMPYWMAPEPQTEVAMIMWFGRNYYDTRMEDMQRISSRALKHDNVFHTLLGVFEVGTEVYNQNLDVLHLARAGSGNSRRYAGLHD